MTNERLAATAVKATISLLLFQMNYIGSDLGKLHEIFDPAILPEELGGDLPSGDILAKVHQHFTQM